MIEKYERIGAQIDSCQIVRWNPLIRVVICDDDACLLERIEEMIANIFAKAEMKAKIHTFTDPRLISAHILSSCDIAFLDIDFSENTFNGMDIARKLRQVRKDAIIIFITNFIEYAPEGYEVQAFRYLLKRELQSELEPYIHQAIDHFNHSKETMKIQLNGEIVDLPIDDILYMEVQQHYVTIYVQKEKAKKELKSYSFYASLSDLEKQLEPQGFLRIHKSYLVNMRHISKFQCREALLDNGLILRVGEKSYAENKRKFLLWKGWQ